MVGVGFDDWEWGVIFWVMNLEYFMDIVYMMCFDEVSVCYVEFGLFYMSYVMLVEEMFCYC